MCAVIYRKYRPSDFDEVVGQEHVVKILKNSIKRGKISHAYLFSGPRGIGKTTIARILAKTVNCLNSKEGRPCNKCENCESINQNKFMDLVEIDAATHTQVDKIRDIIEKINFSPSSGKYKVYIIDEVHMLSKGAFNALLKTLEEPPEHVIFILATTEIHKIPATIISRCQRFDFRRLKISEIKNRLEKIAEKENVKVGKGVFDFIASNSEGGLRDSESLFEQVLSLGGESISLKETQEILAVADTSIAVSLVDLILSEKYSEAIEYVNKITDEGYDLEQFAKLVIEYSRKLLLIKMSPAMKESFLSEMTEEQVEELEKIAGKASLQKLIKIIGVFVKSREDVGSFVVPQLSLELAIAQIDISNGQTSMGRNNGDGGKIKEPLKKITEKVTNSVKNSHEFIKKSINFEKKESEKKEENVLAKTETENTSLVSLEKVKDEWCDILEEVKPQNHSLTAFLKTCQPVDVRGNEVIVSCKYSFHKDKLQKVENRLIIENIASEILKAKVAIKFISKEEAEALGYKSEEFQPKKKKDDLVDSALEMFGGEVV